jgi:hypothetical protein
MSRTLPATLAILVFVTFWIAGAAVLGDYVRPLHWAIQAIYYPVAGFAWVGPVRWLMLWGARQREVRLPWRLADHP